MINEPLQNCGLLPPTLVAKADRSDTLAFRDNGPSVLLVDEKLPKGFVFR